MMEAVRDFLAMDGYAAFVWPSYGLTVLVMVAILVLTLRRLRRHQRELKALEQAVGPRRRRSRDGREAAE